MVLAGTGDVLGEGGGETLTRVRLLSILSQQLLDLSAMVIVVFDQLIDSVANRHLRFAMPYTEITGPYLCIERRKELFQVASRSMELLKEQLPVGRAVMVNQ